MDLLKLVVLLEVQVLVMHNRYNNHQLLEILDILCYHQLLLSTMEILKYRHKILRINQMLDLLQELLLVLLLLLLLLRLLSIKLCSLGKKEIMLEFKIHPMLRIKLEPMIKLGNEVKTHRNYEQDLTVHDCSFYFYFKLSFCFIILLL